MLSKGGAEYLVPGGLLAKLGVFRRIGKGVEVSESAGAMRRLEYVASPKHGKTVKGNVAPAPINAQEALDTSIRIKATSTRRISIDPYTNDFVIFDKTIGNQYHGHIRQWGELTQEMQNTLIRADMVNRRGKLGVK